MARRVGLGKFILNVKHLEIKQFWVQQAVNQKRMAVCKVPGTQNVSDVLTKPMTREVLWRQMEEMQLRQTEGRAERARKVTIDLDKLNNASPLLALLWLGWIPATEATAVK
eukprot:5974287-Amphidinium_carterae.3